MFNVEEELKKLPRKPGVYIMRDDKDVILYVGKAINLHNRVRSYFRENIGRGPAIDQMVSLIARFEYIVTDSELEALVLENNPVVGRIDLKFESVFVVGRKGTEHERLATRP